jgi:hypothetical protein
MRNSRVHSKVTRQNCARVRQWMSVQGPYTRLSRVGTCQAWSGTEPVLGHPLYLSSHSWNISTLSFTSPLFAPSVLFMLLNSLADRVIFETQTRCVFSEIGNPFPGCHDVLCQSRTGFESRTSHDLKWDTIQTLWLRVQIGIKEYIVNYRLLDALFFTYKLSICVLVGKVFA